MTWTAPGAPTYTETASWNTTGASKSTPGAVSWNTGDVIVALGLADDSCTLAAATATGLTFNLVVRNTTVSTCAASISAVRASASGSQVVSMANSSGAVPWGFAVWVIPGATGYNAFKEQHTVTATMPLGVTPHSSVIWAAADFGAVAAPGAAPTPTNTRQNVQFAGLFTIVVADLLDQSTNNASYGFGSAPTGANTIVALEIFGTPGTGDGGGLPDDRYRFRPAVFLGNGTGSSGIQRSGWSDDAQDRSIRDNVADSRSRFL